MGCDIHSVCEVFDEVEGKWKDAGDVFPVEEYMQSFWGKEKWNHPLSSRNYTVFALLAGVRNGYHMVTPISPPRGIPEDWVTREDRKARGGDWDEEESRMNWWSADAHSHSWLLAKELFDADYIGIDDARGLSREFTSTLEILATLGPPDKVRVVFWFDN